MKDDALPQFFAQERFEEGEDDVEEPGLVHDVDGFDAQRDTVLEPVDDLERRIIGKTVAST